MLEQGDFSLWIETFMKKTKILKHFNFFEFLKSFFKFSKHNIIIYFNQYHKEMEQYLVNLFNMHKSITF